MKQLFLVIVLSALPLGVIAADGARDPCSGSGTEDAARCQAKSWESAEKKMQQEYEQTLVKIQKLKDSELTAKFKEAQETWAIYRELQCWAAAYYESPAWSAVWEGNSKATEAKNRAAYL
jgi:uncharacterized protein YecT (DUF1311 family)